ncbi:MAG: hypothetical protein ACK49N_11705 [Verrucomicrobiota bacterium]
MKSIITLITLPLAIIMPSCAPLTQGPAGAWEGMDGTDLIGLNLYENGQCNIRKPAQDMPGTWSTVAPGKAVIRSYYNGDFKMRNNNQATFLFNQRTISMNRVLMQAPPAPPIKKATKTETKKAPQKPRKESYYLNELP